MTVKEFSIKDLEAAISGTDARWHAGRTPFTEMSDDERSVLLDYVPGPGEPSVAEREHIAKANLDAFLATPPITVGYPSSYDLRNVDGKSFVTPVKNQGACGNGIVFDVAAAAEGTFRKQRNNPDLEVDYSEAHLFYCYARSEGRRCGGPSGGWWPSKALDVFRDKGVVDEACFPYTAGDQACALCSDWQHRLTRITGWRELTSTAKMKEWIWSKGPLVTLFAIYQDFLAYKGGIYRHLYGQMQGFTGTCCVGYDDAQKYWICKLSWGTHFGEAGYFRIGYGECGIDSSMYAIEGIEETGWERNKRIIGLWANNQDRNACAFVKDLGWRKVSQESDNIFFNILTQLAAAKAGNRRVDFYQEKGIFRQVYVF